MNFIPSSFDYISSGCSGIVSTLGSTLGCSVCWIVDGRHCCFQRFEAFYFDCMVSFAMNLVDVFESRSLYKGTENSGHNL
jgi:hypothetical protein